MVGIKPKKWPVNWPPSSNSTALIWRSHTHVPSQLIEKSKKIGSGRCINSDANNGKWLWAEGMKTHDDTAVGTNGPKNGNVPILPPHILTGNNLSKHKYSSSNLFTTFFSILSLSPWLQQALYHLHSLKTIVLCHFQPSSSYRHFAGALSGCTGAVIGSTREPLAISIGGPISSFTGQNTGFLLKSGPEEVGFVQTHLGYSYTAFKSAMIWFAVH